MANEAFTPFPDRFYTYDNHAGITHYWGNRARVLARFKRQLTAWYIDISPINVI